jgi:hypothetical protein
MPHASRSLFFLLLLAGCGAPSREADTAAQSWPLRAWRSPDHPVASVNEGGTSRLRAWARDDSDALEALQVGVSLDESVPVDLDGAEQRAWTAPEVAPSSPDTEPAPVEPEPIEIPAREPAPPEPETSAPTETPAETPAPRETPAQVDPAQLVDSRASIVLMWYFQRDDDPDSLDRGEVEEAFAQYDWNKDGVVIELEFDATIGSSADFGREPQGEALELLGGAGPRDALLAAVDSDNDSAFSLNELLAFHDRLFASESN